MPTTRITAHKSSGSPMFQKRPLLPPDLPTTLVKHSAPAETMPTDRTPAQTEDPLLDQRPLWSLEVQTPSPIEMFYSTTGYHGQKIRKETETKEQNTYPTKTNSEIFTLTYKPRCLDTTVRTQPTTARTTCHDQSSVFLLQQVLNTSTQLKHKKMTLKSTL